MLCQQIFSLTLYRHIPLLLNEGQVCPHWWQDEDIAPKYHRKRSTANPEFTGVKRNARLQRPEKLIFPGPL